ncbi:MAG: hypothetical protein HDS24_05980 [Bacteroides sp.]|nr:hypothetical protein [Bacteroides sp.]
MMESWSGWKVWWHPLSARDELHDLLEELESSREELERLREAEAQRDGEIAGLREERGMLLGELAREREEKEQLADNRARLQRELAELREELADRKSTEEQINLFEEKLKGVETLKADYEKQISRLSGRICDLQAALSGDEPSELEEIDMTSTDVPERPPRRRRGVSELDRPENNWLEPLPEI